MKLLSSKHQQHLNLSRSQVVFLQQLCISSKATFIIFSLREIISLLLIHIYK